MTRHLAALGLLGTLAACSVEVTPSLTLVGRGTHGTGSATGRPTAGASTGNGTTGATSSGTVGTTTSGVGSIGTGTTSTGTTGSATASGTTTGSTTSSPCGCPAGKHCAPDGTPRCLDCVADSDCSALPDGGVCQRSDAYLQYGECVQCTEAEPSCPGTEVCDLSIGRSYHQCVADCRLATTVPPCPPDFFGDPQYCVQDSGTCGPHCADDSDCAPSSQVCDTDAGACVQCLDDTQCSQPTPVCLAGFQQANRCVQCVLPSQCPDTSPGCAFYQCGTCGGDTDCPTNIPLCNDQNQCIASCVLSDGGTSCATGGCDTTTGFCVECVVDSNCTQPDAPYCATDIDAGEYCVQCFNPNQCPTSSPGCGPFGCGSCWTDVDCPATAPFCSGDYQCVIPCDGGTTCATGACDTDAGYCVQCVDDSDCQEPDASYCATDLGYGNYCVQCVASSDCGDAGPCNSGYLTCGSCYADSDCPPEVPMCTYGSPDYCTDGGF
jgi:hypothetical protein